MKLVVTHSPHIKTSETTKRIMTDVLIALIPVTVSAVFNFGVRAILLMLVSVLTAMVTESLLRNYKKGIGYALNPINLYSDGSAAVTGLIFAHILTPLLPLWMAAIGTFLAIFIGKYVFGGLGQNCFNPALVGRAALLMAFPAFMSKEWILPVDKVVGATPLVTGEGDYLMLFLGRVGGCIGETSVIAILLGGLYLLYRGHITWHTPVAFLGSTAILSYIFGVDPLFAVLAGGVAYGAIFMATDMVTTPMTRRGQFIFGLGCGLVTVVIRIFGGLPEGVMYSILIMNAFTPLIDKIVKPRLFGGGVNA
ncbi:RnfABCDGE type electron transport complex subunit D [Clostridium sp. 'deep sea']|uniref:RnfABCDGE type electron transport complex subunit D n=1 Tax=Clostridium sp. 'deep sea' TaxID=2779445 RepID=UPI00189670E5|nr:RnfABCDGE type electron transport complex subunit D [Clostridium sp. 'deep sea']QOR36061.1 RnfABCDGE type electron transport complex subunit D [Clostridium sp. 'deep sea']